MRTFWIVFLSSLTLAAAAFAVIYARRWRSLRRQHRELSEELERQRSAARAQEARQKDLVAFLAHDLKTPLTSVVGYLTILKSRPDLTREERSRYTAVALDKAQRLEELLGEFFDISRMELGGEVGRREPVALSLLLEQLADEFYPLLASKELTLNARIQSGLATLGDADRLARVFDNVLRNAVSYSTPGGVIDLTAQRVGRSVQVRISNQGLGIPEGELSNIFQRFYRLDAARSSRTGGAGLGLAIAKEIVDSHGGAIAAESTGQRVTFQITLPAQE